MDIVTLMCALPFVLYVADRWRERAERRAVLNKLVENGPMTAAELLASSRVIWKYSLPSTLGDYEDDGVVVRELLVGAKPGGYDWKFRVVGLEEGTH